MISILRSNQPIAWATVPATIACGIAVQVGVGTLDGLSAGLHGVGLTALAYAGHQLYVNRHFVERGDSALAWLVSFWCIATLRPIDWVEGIRLWSGLLLSCWSLATALTMHRQSSTSGIQFRSGTLAGLAAACCPSTWGLLLGLIVMQLNLRPGIGREWSMLFIGWLWGAGVAAGLGHFAFGIPWSQPAVFDAFDVHNGLHWAALAWALGGALALLRQQSSLNLRAQNARFSVLVVTWLIAAGAMVNWTGSDVTAEPLALTPALGLALAFSTVCLVPKRERNRSGNRTWVDAVFWALVGTVLVLFVQQLLN